MKKKLKIDNTIALDFYLVGLVCGLKDYKICARINRAMRMDFNRDDDLKIKFNNPSKSQKHKRYAYATDFGEEFELIANKGENYQLIPEHRNIDYFLIIRNILEDEDLYLLAEQLRGVPRNDGGFRFGSIFSKIQTQSPVLMLKLLCNYAPF